MSSCIDDRKVHGGLRYTAKYGTLLAVAATLFNEGGREGGSALGLSPSRSSSSRMDGWNGSKDVKEVGPLR